MENKKYTRAEIAKIAPNYRGKPENFNPDFKKAERPVKSEKKEEAKSRPPRVDEKPIANPTPQKNATLWDNAIFGTEVSVKELDCFQEHKPTFARLGSIIAETYGSMTSDDGAIGKQLSKEMLMYYATALLWARLLCVKSKLKQQLTETERDYLNIFETMSFNMPQPLYLFIKGIGCVRDKSGKELNLAAHTLPTAIAGGKNGYIASTMTAVNHVEFEEIPSLGVCGDVLQAQSSGEVLSMGFLPANRNPTRNMAGYFGQIPIVKEEIRIILSSFGVDGNRFEENITGTRLNIGLMQFVSAYLVKSSTFRNEVVEMGALTIEGSLTQLVKTKPVTDVSDGMSWTETTVRPLASFSDDLTVFGSSYFAGYRLYKEGITTIVVVDEVADEQVDHTSWYPITGDVDQAWVATRNSRRAGLPDGMDAERYAAVSNSQFNQTVKFIAKMVQASR